MEEDKVIKGQPRSFLKKMKDVAEDKEHQIEFLGTIVRLGVVVWSGTVPSWADVVAKQAALKKADEDNEATKVSGYKKLGLTDEEIAAITN